jgi:RHS repeat-associated protein
MTTTRQYDLLNRLQSVSSSPSSSSSSAIAFGYLYNDGNQRTRRTEADGSYWVYQYDALGQVISGKRYWSDGTPVPGQQFEYGFDDIGNRTSTKAGGDANGANLRSASYTATPTNTYSSRTVPGGFDVVGLANNAASVTVNSSPSDYRRGEYFQELVTTNNSSAPVWLQVNVSAVNGGSSSNWPAGYVFVPRTAEAFTYDQDGNLTSDGRWTYTWDGENRLTRLVAVTAVGPQQRIDFAYDWQGRRIAKTVWPNTGGTGTPLLNNRFLYDGWNLVAELNATNNAVIRRYQWGLDLSGSEQGAGGVGGLLSISYLPAPTSSFVAYDGNGNVAGLVDVVTGAVTANYEYGPFAEPIRMSGAVSRANPFRFSTKYQDDETDLLYYGYRYYSPSLGRWLSRDPVAGVDGSPLYVFLKGDPVNGADLLGLASWPFDTPHWEHSRAAIQLHSEGYAFRDPNYASLWWERQSALRPDANAWFTAWASPFWRLAVCNSGNELFDDYYPPNSTSYVAAWIRNNTCGCTRIRVSCRAAAFVMIYGDVNDTWKAFWMQGHLLEQNTEPDQTHNIGFRRPDSTYDGFVWYMSSRTREFAIQPGEWRQLYYLWMMVRVDVKSPLSGGFLEHSEVECTVENLGSCD